MDKIDRILGSLKPSPVPDGLASRIIMAVDKRALILERRQLSLEVIRLAFGMTAMIYGFTAVILNFLNGDFSSYLNAVIDDPSVLISYEGAMALLEQLPVLSVCLFFGGLVYSVRHLMLRGFYTRRLSSVMAGLFVVVAFSAFVGGIAVGSNQIGTPVTNASSILFQPLVIQSSKYVYSISGEVTQITNLNEETLEVTLLLSNGDSKNVTVPLSVLKDKQKIEEGDTIYVLGKPDKLNDNLNMKAKFIQFEE